MKKIAILILGLLSLNLIAQDPQLFDNTWHLHSLVINGDTHIPPSNNEVTNVTANFYATNEFDSTVCDSLEGILNYVNSEFMFDVWGVMLGGCAQQVNTDFQQLYLDTFLVPSINDPFTYTIVDDGNGSKTLTVTNILGDDAIYGSQILSIPELTKDSFNVYPNPSSDKVFISTALDLTELVINVIDITGSKVFTIDGNKLKNSGINIRDLSNGMYFIILTDVDGNNTVKKLIKN